MNSCRSQAKVTRILQLMVSWSVCPGVKPPFGTHEQFFFSFSLKLSLDSRGIIIMGVPSLTRGRVCNSQLLLGLASAVFLGSKFCGTRDQISLSQIGDSSNLDGQDSIFISTQEQCSSAIPPIIGFVSFIYMLVHDISVVMYMQYIYIYIYTGLLSVQAQYSRLCNLKSSSGHISLITLMVIRLTTPKFKPLIFSVSGFALTNILNMCIFTDLCLLPA
jgi:hypothetical protein